MKETAQPGNRTCKTPYIRLDTLQTAITGMENIKGYHQLGLLILLSNGSLMKVESIAECILQYF